MHSKLLKPLLAAAAGVSILTLAYYWSTKTNAEDTPTQVSATEQTGSSTGTETPKTGAFLGPVANNTPTQVPAIVQTGPSPGTETSYTVSRPDGSEPFTRDFMSNFYHRMGKGETYEYLLSILKDDPQMVRKVLLDENIMSDVQSYEYNSTSAKCNLDPKLAFRFRMWIPSLDCVPEKLLVKQRFYDSVVDHFLDDESVILKAIEYNGPYLSWGLQYVSERLRDNQSVVLKAIEHNVPYCFRHASRRLRDDESVVLKAIEHNVFDPYAPSCRNLEDSFLGLSESLRNNKSVVLKAIEHNVPDCFPFASDRLRDDKDVVLKAIEHKGKR